MAIVMLARADISAPAEADLQVAAGPVDSLPPILVRSTEAHASVPRAPRYRVSSFDGPLDLLLRLIRANDLDIYDIPIAQITRQYLEHVRSVEALDLDGAGEYVVMAATLIEIKSRMLLPTPPREADADDAEDPRAELVARLLEYELYQSTAQMLGEHESARAELHFRALFQSGEDYTLAIPEREVSAEGLHAALLKALEAAGRRPPDPAVVAPRRRPNIGLAMARILRAVRRPMSEPVAFDDLWDAGADAHEIVVLFLALLELVRAGQIRVRQRGATLQIAVRAAPKAGR